MKSHRALILIAALFLLCTSAVAAKAVALRVASSQDESTLFGNWSGESLCQLKGTACKDEKVVYHIARSKEPAKVTITADKIVDGNPVTMGTGDWDYDKEKQTLTWNRWKLTINGNRMNGTLVTVDGALIRKMWLKKDEK